MPGSLVATIGAKEEPPEGSDEQLEKLPPDLVELILAPCLGKDEAERLARPRTRRGYERRPVADDFEVLAVAISSGTVIVISSPASARRSFLEIFDSQ